MVGWHHQLNGHEFEQAPGVGDGQGSLACCSSWGHKELEQQQQFLRVLLPELISLSHPFYGLNVIIIHILHVTKLKHKIK